MRRTRLIDVNIFEFEKTLMIPPPRNTQRVRGAAKPKNYADTHLAVVEQKP
jgi:hypothetical protein